MHIGTTSAYAENTEKHWAGQTYCANYLRVRGEYKPLIASSADWVELPPRTRRIRIRPKGRVQALGTTSAYAENTAWARPRASHPKNYLRVRGEYRF